MSKLYIHTNGKVGTKEYFDQCAIDNWFDNINNVTSKFDDISQYIYEYRTSCLTLAPANYDGYVYTLLDALGLKHCL